MVQFVKILMLVAGFFTHIEAYDQSLVDCKEVAAKFRNTCAHGNYDTPAASMDEMESESFTCPGKPRCIPSGTVSGQDCTWERKLCVTCSRVNGVTKIRVQTNNLPDHCIESVSVKAQNFDYEVTFNAQQTYDSWGSTFSRQYQLNNAVCPINKNYDATALGIEELSDSAESVNAMGIALNGVAFQFANTIQEDPVYPITVLNEQPLDLCLGHNQQNSDSGMYHYHHISPCINPDFLSGIDMASCADYDDCANDISAWAISSFSNWNKEVIGIGKDGHVLYSPYNSNGDLWTPAEVDGCNGAWSDDHMDYFYVGTQWHPYLVGCMGSANKPHVEYSLYPQCSLNGIDKYITEEAELIRTNERLKRANQVLRETLKDLSAN